MARREPDTSMTRPPRRGGMAKATIITCAVTGSGDTVGKNPAVPVTPEQIAESAIGAARAGAAVAHIHVRDPETGVPAMDVALYREAVERIRGSGTDVLINLTTGPGARFVPGDDDPLAAGPGTTLANPERRVEHIRALTPDICSLDVATMNFGERAFINVPAHLRKMARSIREAGVLPELEVFDAGHVRLAARLIADGHVPPPHLFQIVLGVPWGAPATPEAMLFMRDQLPEGVNWAAFGISHQEFPMVAQAVLLGGHVRVGLEDNLYLERGVLAPSNAALVERAVRIVREIGGTVAEPAEAREILGIQPATV